MTPLVSVIMPVYNSETYLEEAMNSILAQSFRDFEFVIVNDGSTDRSAEIIKSYSDKRIRYLDNGQNRGLVYSLNRAVSEAQGTYMARMDADDVALPHRLEKQLQYLNNSTASLLATTVKLIDAEGRPLPEWKDDQRNLTFKQIKKFLVKNNCLAHPSVMGKADVFRKYAYQPKQRYAEDYDLWLRVVADGCRIEKLQESLLLYRILPTSFTRSKKRNIFYGLASVKFSFVGEQVKKGKISSYVLLIFLYACLDLLKAAGKRVKAIFVK